MGRSTDLTTQRIANRRAANRAAGGKHINTAIGPEAATALAQLRKTMGMRHAIERALILLAKSLDNLNP